MKNEEKRKLNTMNIIALNQTLFKKSTILGKGFSEGDKKSASTTPRGYHLWINGIHELPEISEITEEYELGVLDYPFLMNGMGDGVQTEE